MRAVPRGKARKEGIPLYMDIADVPEDAKDGRVISVMIPFKSIATDEAQKALEGFKDPDGLFQVFERTNAILVTDTQENINRMLEIAKAIDIATPVLEDVFVRQIKYAVANDIKTALETIVTESQKESQAKEVGPKSSGAPGFASRAPTPMPGSRLLNLNNRPGAQRPPEPVKANDPMIAAVSDADRGMIRGKVLILADERSNKLIVITMKSNMDFFDRVIETLDVETEPEFKVEVVRLKYAEAEDVESMLNDLIGGTSSSSSKENRNQNAKTATSTKQNLTPGAKPGTASAASGKKSNIHQGSVGDLNKDNCKVLADKRINGIVVMTRTELMPIIMKVIDDMDVRLSQVLIETVIIEVTLGDELSTGIDWVQRGRARITSQDHVRNQLGQNMYYMQRIVSTSDGNSTTEILKDMVPDDYSKTTQTTDDDGVTRTVTEAASSVPVLKNVSSLVRDSSFFNQGGSMLGGGGGSGSSALQSLFTTVATNAADAALGANPIGSGINYYLKSDKLNLAAIISATKSDNRAKYIASPIVMTVDNKEATVEATSSRQFLTGWTAVSGSYAGSGLPSPNYSSKDIGITLKMTPKINPNGTVMLTVEEEYSQVSEKQTMLSPQNDQYVTTVIDVPVTRKMSADVRLENRQTIVLGGLTETTIGESETGIPILKDIPYIGKWLFGKVEQSEGRKELLVFLTPYVLDDEQSAQLEALRRKKALSDPNPWDDHGWSASPLADPVSKREQLRRFQDEWKKQDEERKTKLAIEKAKVERAKKLENMTKEEREFWIELHKDELEKEQKEAFEKQVKEQEDLKEFVETLKKPKMEKAEKAIKENEKALQSENEYHKVLEKMKESGKPLPAGETLNRDAAEIKGDNGDKGLKGDKDLKGEEGAKEGRAASPLAAEGESKAPKAVKAPEDAAAAKPQSDVVGLLQDLEPKKKDQ
jgi:type II secretory pathway component GspD/PulD (secretin)